MPAFQSDDTPLLIAVTIDCNDLDLMTGFWSKLLGVEGAVHDQFGFLDHAPDRKVTIWLQQVPEGRSGKNRVHLDFAVPDLDATLRRIEELGGSVGDQHEWRGHVWRTCSDPEGNVFDVMQAQLPGESTGET